MNPDIKHQVKNHLKMVYLLEDEQIDQIFITAAQTLTENLLTATSALENNDYGQLGEAAHSIKGSLLNLGLNDLAEKAKEIEINAKNNMDIDFKPLLYRLDKNFKDLLEKS